jgi:hypothetical protein
MSLASRSTSAIVLLLALLACGGGDDSRCSASLSRNGQTSNATGIDRIAAQHNACRAWCQSHDSAVAAATDKEKNQTLVGCASACGGDILFGSATAGVTCK